MDLYAENILEHYRNPHKKSSLSVGPPGQQGMGDKSEESPPSPRGRGQGEGPLQHTESNPACGDEITVGLNFQNSYIQDIHWDGTGCAISQAAMSMLSEELAGKSPESIDALTKDDVLKLLGVPISPRRLKCALLGLHACKNALRKAQGETTRGWAESVFYNGAAGED